MDAKELLKKIRESIINEAKEYPKMLSTLLRKCWYDGNGKFARNGKWSIGLGGYDHGYEVYFDGETICQIKPDNEVYFGRDEYTVKRICGYGYEQILAAVQEVESNAFIANQEYKLIVEYEKGNDNHCQELYKILSDNEISYDESGDGYYCFYSEDEDELYNISAIIKDCDENKHFSTRIIEV